MAPKAKVKGKATKAKGNGKAAKGKVPKAKVKGKATKPKGTGKAPKAKGRSGTAAKEIFQRLRDRAQEAELALQQHHYLLLAKPENQALELPEHIRSQALASLALLSQEDLKTVIAQLSVARLSLLARLSLAQLSFSSGLVEAEGEGEGEGEARFQL